MMPKSKSKTDKTESSNQPTEAAVETKTNGNVEPENEHELTEESEKQEKDRKIKEKKHDSGAADLERVTDYAEEKEISEGEISKVRGLIEEELAGRIAKERELMKVKIKKDDIQLLVNELEISQEKAERALREHSGDLIATLVTLTN